jgi:Fe-coproporphyrin III synthase
MSRFIRFVKFVSRAKPVTDFPRVVNYDITWRCNLHCQHCYWLKNNSDLKDLSDDVWIKTFRTHRRRGANTAYLTGGEPTLRPRLLAAADQIFPELSIVTNGTKPVSKKIQRRLWVSIDGPRDLHNQIRGAQIFDQVLENIKGDERVILTPTLTTVNYKYVDDLVQIARDCRVAGITFSTYTSHQGLDDPLLLGGEQLDRVIKRLTVLRRRYPETVMITPAIVNSWRKKKYRHNCFFRSKKFRSFDAALQIKKPCTLGAGVKCETCGCIVPVIAGSLRKLDLPTWFLLDRLFPTRYCRI